jgi:hypothetical protein
MKKYLLIPIVVALAACSSAPKVAEVQTKPDIVIDSAPSWMVKLPKEEGAVYGNATARSRDYEMAVEKATSLAQGKVAESMAAVVSKQTKTYRQDTGSRFTENSVSITRKVANDVDFAGTELVDVKVIRESDGYYRVYALVKLSYGDSNPVLRTRAEKAVNDPAAIEREFNDLDKSKAVVTPVTTAPTIEVTPATQIDKSKSLGLNSNDPVVVAKFNDALSKPGAVVIKASVQ